MPGPDSFLKENAALICDRYADGVANARSKAGIASLLDVNVCEWLCMMEPSHGASEWLLRYFGGFVNGAFVKDCGDYTCEVYAGFSGDLELRADVTALVGCGDVRVHVPDSMTARVYFSGRRLDVSLGGRSSLLAGYTAGSGVVGDMERVTAKMIGSHA